MGQNNGCTRFLTRLVKEKPLGTASGVVVLILILGNYSGASHRPEAGVVMGETAVVSQEDL